MSEFSKKYNPADFESNIYKNWEENALFMPKESTTGEKFFIPMPPPNVTGVLHLGHALTLTLEDIMTRYHRMKGDKTLWLPGTDHAGISTQAKVEQKLAAEGKTKHDLTREEFLDEAWDWKDKHGDIITTQMRKMGASCDWSREKFTMDEDLNKRVTKAFVDLYNKGLIYRGEYMVNYSPGLNTVISDAEVEYKEEKAKLYYVTYFVSGSDKEIVVATTRPETMLGDVAVAVHPKDKRYKKLVKAGKKLILPIVNKEIPIVFDEMVDMEFGTGAVKLTPAHDKDDFEAAKRLELPLDEVVLSKDGIMTAKAGIFEGQDYMTARKNIIELLKAKGNLKAIENYDHRVGYCERSGAKVETIISKQWFVKIAPIAEKVIAGYKKKEFEVIPSRFNKTFEDWLFKLNDWCISRQLYWGHQIPIYYNNETGEAVASEEDLTKTGDYTRDPDVLDTWFSSAMWPFSTLGYDMWGGEQPQDVKDFYSADMLETGHDIIFFWCIRMLLFGYEFTGETPIKKFYLHGLIFDKEGKKMSKSLGNGIDPLDVIAEHGTDALRMTLTIGNTPGNNLKFDMDNVIQSKMFINKLWNATRFVYTNFEKTGSKVETDMDKLGSELVEKYDDLMLHEKWILSRLKTIINGTTKGMNEYLFSESGADLYAFTKNEFCDYYIEEYKNASENSKYGEKVITFVINSLLKLWHPYIPFVTEELYNKLGFTGDLISQKWINFDLSEDKEIVKQKNKIIEVIKTIRQIRAENAIMPSKQIKLHITAKANYKDLINSWEYIISPIVKSEVTVVNTTKPENADEMALGVVKGGIEIYVNTDNALDKDKEIERLNLQISDTKDYICILDKKLLNESFVANAPKDLVRAEMDKKDKAIEKLAKLEEKLTRLK
ncbi:MAG: valine--tRNA ligase [Candidatus Gracilibacteria bacterium]|nr:valine--tRNA ligase [Candidatus Gracilibacteria bacterium]